MTPLCIDRGRESLVDDLKNIKLRSQDTGFQGTVNKLRWNGKGAMLERMKSRKRRLVVGNSYSAELKVPVSRVSQPVHLTSQEAFLVKRLSLRHWFALYLQVKCSTDLEFKKN